MDIILLVTIILMPPAMVILGVILFLGSSSFKLNAEKGLLKQGLLWISMLLPIAYFIVFGAIAWNGYSIDISSQGLSTFFEISKIPLSFLSLALPLTILTTRFHATEQTAKQIAITRHKNNLDAFYTHRKELFSYFSQIRETDYFGALTGSNKVHPRLHKIFFTGCPDLGFPEVNEKSFKMLEALLDSTRGHIDAVLKNKNSNENFDIYMLNACPSILSLAHLLGLFEIIHDYSFKSVSLKINVNGKEEFEYRSIGTTTDHLVASFRYANDYFKNLCDFAGYTVSETIEEYKYIDTGGKYRTMVIPKVIEKLHQNEIKNLKEKQAEV